MLKTGCPIAENRKNIIFAPKIRLMTKKVFVSGCYDLLHSGHVEFFRQAAQFGDLYVGIGSDETILFSAIFSWDFISA